MSVQLVVKNVLLNKKISAIKVGDLMLVNMWAVRLENWAIK